MLVKFNHQMQPSDLKGWTEQRICRYNYEKSNFSQNSSYPVYGILMFPHFTLFWIGCVQNMPFLGLYDAGFFKIEDNSGSRFWRFFPGLAHRSLAYDGLDFGCFNYIGIDRLVTEPLFYENYLNDCSSEVAYIQKMKTFIDRESVSDQDTAAMTRVQPELVVCCRCTTAFESRPLGRHIVQCPHCHAIGKVEDEPFSGSAPTDDSITAG